MVGLGKFNCVWSLELRYNLPLCSIQIAFSVLHIYGYPRFKTGSLGFVLTFPASLWGLIALTFLFMVMFFLASYNVYSNHYMPTERFIRSGINANDIVFKVLGTLTEPEAITIFTSYNAGIF